VAIYQKLPSPSVWPDGLIAAALAPLIRRRRLEWGRARPAQGNCITRSFNFFLPSTPTGQQAWG
jgi:hypothetical protein